MPFSNENEGSPIYQGEETPVLKDPLIGFTLANRYKIIELIGSGGWGNVYRATHLALDSDVAIKVIHNHHAQNMGSLKRLEQEAKVLNKLDSPSIVRIIDYGSAPAHYIVMEYFDGIQLSQWLRENGAMSYELAMELFLQISEGLSAAQSFGLVHRDLKPANILLKSDNRALKAKIVDLGLAKLMNERDTTEERLTATGEILGSPGYMSPEQWRGTCDHRADIYSFGCIMYEVISGTPLFTAKYGLDYLSKHLDETPDRIADRNPAARFPAALENVIFKCLQKNPDHRYQSSSALRSDLMKIKTGRRPVIVLAENKSNVALKKTLLVSAAVSACTLLLLLLKEPVIMPLISAATGNKNQLASTNIISKDESHKVSQVEAPKKTPEASTTAPGGGKKIAQDTHHIESISSKGHKINLSDSGVKPATTSTKLTQTDTRSPRTNTPRAQTGTPPSSAGSEPKKQKSGTVNASNSELGSNENTSKNDSQKLGSPLDPSATSKLARSASTGKLAGSASTDKPAPSENARKFATNKAIAKDSQQKLVIALAPVAVPTPTTEKKGAKPEAETGTETGAESESADNPLEADASPDGATPVKADEASATIKKKVIPAEKQLHVTELSSDGKIVEYHLAGQAGKPGIYFKLPKRYKISTDTRANSVIIGGGGSRLEIRLVKSEGYTVSAVARRAVRAHRRAKNYIANAELQNVQIGKDNAIQSILEDFNNDSKGGHQYHQKHYYFGWDGFCYKVVSLAAEKTDARMEKLCAAFLASLRLG